MKHGRNVQRMGKASVHPSQTQLFSQSYESDCPPDMFCHPIVLPKIKIPIQAVNGVPWGLWIEMRWNRTHNIKPWLSVGTQSRSNGCLQFRGQERGCGCEKSIRVDVHKDSCPTYSFPEARNRTLSFSDYTQRAGETIESTYVHTSHTGTQVKAYPPPQPPSIFYINNSAVKPRECSSCPLTSASGLFLHPPIGVPTTPSNAVSV